MRLFTADDRAHLVTQDYLGRPDKAARLDEAEVKARQWVGLAAILAFLVGAIAHAVLT
ncbi:MAG: hypothetical protein ACYC3F_17110 [Gemmatimonadaceae bacterium]